MSKRTRDMTERQFRAALDRHGFKSEGFMGYYNIGSGVSVSVLNAGPTRRARLAYLIQQRDRIEREQIDKGRNDKS